MKSLFLVLILVSTAASADQGDINASVDDVMASILEVQKVVVRNYDQPMEVLKEAVCDSVYDVHAAVAELSWYVRRNTDRDATARNTLSVIQSADDQIAAYCEGAIVTDPLYRLYNPGDVMRKLQQIGTLALILKR